MELTYTQGQPLPAPVIYSGKMLDCENAETQESFPLLVSTSATWLTAKRVGAENTIQVEISVAWDRLAPGLYGADVLLALPADSQCQAGYTPLSIPIVATVRAAPPPPPPPPPPEPEPLSISITSPSNGQVINGRWIDLVIAKSGDVKEIRIFVNGVAVGSLTGSTAVMRIDAHKYKKATHVIAATASDMAGRVASTSTSAVFGK